MGHTHSNAFAHIPYANTQRTCGEHDKYDFTQAAGLRNMTQNRWPNRHTHTLDLRVSQENVIFLVICFNNLYKALECNKAVESQDLPAEPLRRFAFIDELQF